MMNCPFLSTTTFPFIRQFVPSPQKMLSCVPYKTTMQPTLLISPRPKNPNTGLNGSPLSMRSWNHSSQKASMRKLTDYRPVKRLYSANGSYTSNETRTAPFPVSKLALLRRDSLRFPVKILLALSPPSHSGTPFGHYFALGPHMTIVCSNST